MTTKPSDAPWADEPYRLIPIPSNRLDINSHSYVYCASEMAYSHNCLLRGLNAILLQAPHVPSSGSPGYTAQDVRDLLFYVASWVKTVEWHHHTEETCMFPDIEAFTGQPGIMDGPKGQHEEFTPGLDRLLRYAQEMPPEEYRWEGPGGMKEIIDGFAPSLTKHLYEEIDVFLGMGNLDSAGLRRCWDEAEEVAKAKGKFYMLYDVFPCVLGTCDKTYEGGNEFPPLPAVLPYVIKYWFGARNKGAWRFNPCDFWGQPVPLHFLPENRGKK
ncbi:hypothetical protein VTN00DRAFT_2359 [Thermoascus crustaceus]|uniref:uncharacterized protein n=1 Tax=Thermoascus crustaceus TaxID=5088 RepID=UPI0037436D9B